MATEPTIGRNRTGLAASKMQPLRLVDPESTDIPEGAGVLDKETFWEGHLDMIQESDPIGSIPIPPSFKGMGKAALETLKGNRPDMLINKLGERLAFERSGTRLYDMLLCKCEINGDIDEQALGELREIRDEELSHFHMLNDIMVEMGADPTSQTPAADIAGVASMGLFQVVSDPRTTVLQCLDAILIAELTDESCWETLVTIATDFGLDDMASQFQEAHLAEERHVNVVKALMNRMLMGVPTDEEDERLSEGF